MRHLLALTLTSCVLACSPPSPPQLADGGDALELDAGASLSPDAGVAAFLDAGDGADASVALPDAGPSPDAGAAEFDAGLEADAGAETFDAGLTIDGGAVTPDAGPSVVDAGCQCTASETCVAGRCVPDTTPPQLSVTASAGASATTLRVFGTVTDAETGVTTVELRFAGQGAVTVPVVSGAFDTELPVPTGRAEYTVFATVRDRAGNVATAQTTFDAAAPTVSLTPTDDGACTPTGCTGAVLDATATSFSLTAQVTDGFALAAAHPVQVRVLDGTTELVGWTDLTRQPSGSWSWTWAPLPVLDFTRLTVEVVATDAANNRGTARRTVLLDRVRPSLTFTPATSAMCTATACTGTVVNGATTSLDLTGLVSEDASVRVRILDGAAEVQAPVAVPQASGSWAWSWTSFPAVDGRFFTLEVTATDALRNTAARQLVVLVDRSSPGLLVNAPRAGTLVGTAQVTVDASATDGLGLKRVEVATSPSGPFTAATRNAGGAFIAQVDVPVVDAVEQTLTVRAVDLADNVSTTSARYTADRVAPVLGVGGADFDCTGPNACTGSVANASSTQLVYGGTVRDGSAVTVQTTLVGPSGTVASSSGAAVGTLWSWTWSSLPAGVNGAAYELRVTATDAAGNVSAQQARRTWVDTVAPTVGLPVAGQRNVDPGAVLAVFSEPMDVASVTAATSVTPSLALTGFGSSDGQHFQFSGTPKLPTYVPHTLTFGPARDKAGNPAPTASASFLTAPYAWPSHFFLTQTTGLACRSPRIAVDADGRFTVAAALPSTSSTSTWFIRDTGTSAQTAMFGVRGTAATLEVPTDLRIASASRQADQRLVMDLDVGTVVSFGGNAMLGRHALTFSWTGVDETPGGTPRVTLGDTAALSASTLAQNRPVVDLVPARDLLSGTVSRTRALVAPNNGGTAMLWWRATPGWTSFSSGALSSFQSLDGRASVEATGILGQYRVRFWDLGQVSEVSVGNLIRSATAQPVFKDLDRLGNVVPTSSAFAAWTTETELRVGCSAAPFSGAPAWLSSAVTLPARTSGTPLASAQSGSTFVVAGEYGGDVYVYSAPLTSCGSAPVLTQVGRIAGVREPGVTIDASGRIWVVSVGANGLFVTRF